MTSLSLSLLPTTNISFYTIPLAWTLALLTRLYATSLYESASKKPFDHTQPRSLGAKVARDQTLDQATKDRIIRAEGAQSNAFENIGLFAAAVVAGNMAGMETGYVNGLSVGYVGSRVLYTVVYVNNSSNGMARGRGAVFMVGVGICMALFVGAGRRMGGGE